MAAELRVVTTGEPEPEKKLAEPEVALRRLYKIRRRMKRQAAEIEKAITVERKRLATKRGLPTIWPNIAEQEFDR